MSLDGLRGALWDQEDESYSPGESGYDPGIVDDLFNDFIRRGIPDWSKEWSRKLQEEYAPRFRLFGSFNGQLLLDEIVKRYNGVIVEARREDPGGRNIHHFLNPLLQVLYDVGENGLTLDMSDYPHTYGDLPGILAGSAEDPFSIRFITGSQTVMFSNVSEGTYVARSVGWKLDHVALHAAGSTFYFGGDCRNSDLTLDGHVSKLGYGSSDCIFRLEGAERASMKMHAKHQWEKSTDGSAYTLLVTRKGICWDTDLQLEFWDEGNTLLVPDGSGGWMEVLP